MSRSSSELRYAGMRSDVRRERRDRDPKPETGAKVEAASRRFSRNWMAEPRHLRASLRRRRTALRLSFPAEWPIKELNRLKHEPAALRFSQAPSPILGSKLRGVSGLWTPLQESRRYGLRRALPAVREIRAGAHRRARHEFALLHFRLRNLRNRPPTERLSRNWRAALLFSLLDGERHLYRDSGPVQPGFRKQIGLQRARCALACGAIGPEVLPFFLLLGILRDRVGGFFRV